MTYMEIFESVTLKLQSDDLDLSEARALFDATTERYRSMSSYLSDHADIIHDPDFENGIIEILNKKAHAKKKEQSLVSCFLIPGESDQEGAEEKDFAQGVISRKRRKIWGKESNKYICLKFINPTINGAERTFSQSKYVLHPESSSMSPHHFEF